ncbi:MAG: glycerophosphodiester phosphodiesterase family protein [Patescibacteria group bacterium]|nr:glycerophosphodiester phosphodiesterase family protein [Patescibacteria group bacterium]
MFKIGHRGAAGYAPENTLASFQKALDLKVDMIELDVYQCHSEELVVMHDDKVDRTTNGHGYVWEKTLKELKKLEAVAGEKIPTLRQVLDLIDKKVPVNIELKEENTAQSVAQIINQYKNKGWSDEDFIISSFNHIELQKIKKLQPKIKIGALLCGMPADYATLAEKMGTYSINPNLEFINQEFVDDAHARGLKIFVWTVNDKDDIERMKNLGVDGLFSNYPDRF